LRITYDPEVDVLRVVFRDVAIAKSDEEKPGVILDYDAGGEIVALELLDASRRVSNPRAVELEVAG
jgi:uncharacterized protein YuzE